MGWNPEEGYYQKHVKEKGCSNKITDEQEKFNKLDPEQVKEGIDVAKGIDKPKSNEPIEYVVEIDEDELEM